MIRLASPAHQPAERDPEPPPMVESGQLPGSDNT